jgi:SAM-dependent methyltransferase
MDEAEFDKFATEYRNLHAANIRITGEEPEYFAEYKVIDIAAELERVHGGAAHPAVLDFGAGIGYSVPFFRRHLPAATVTCIDVSKKSLELGAAQHGAAASFKHFDGAAIPYPAETFDVGLASCVFHHIPHDEHIALLSELHRVLKRRGLLFIFEHNPLNPLTQRAVNTCPFDENARLIRAGTMRARVHEAGFDAPRIRYRIFFPHVLRGLRPLEQWLAWLPLGGQYCVIARK